MAQVRLSLCAPIETRDGTLAKDSRSVNGYFETFGGRKEFVKRPGITSVTTSPALPNAQGQGMTYFNGFLYAVINNVIYKINPSTYAVTTVGTMTGTVGGQVQTCYFAQSLNNTYLFVHNQVNGYTINGNTGAFVQVTNNKVASTTIQTGGTLYSNGTTVTFSAPPSGTTATGTIQTTSGIITGISITNGGSGYVTAPTITFTPAPAVNGVSVTNSAGTNALTAASLSGTVYVGMTVIGTGVPNNTTVTAISGSGPYLITLSTTTTSSVTSVSFQDLGSGAAAISLLNGFPSGQLATGAAYFDTYTVVAGVNGQIYTSNVNDPTTWNALNYITAQADPDPLVGIAKHLNYIMAFGTNSVEFFYDAGTYPGSPLAVSPSYKIEIGCANGNSIVSFENMTLWVGLNQELGASVYAVSGAAPERVSTPFIDRILSNSTLATVTAYAMRVNGHTFYVLTLHDLNVTIVYDLNEKAWYQWTMWAVGNASSGVTGIYAEQYFRPSYFSSAGNTYFLLDDDNGTLYTMSDLYYNDNGAPIYYRVVSENIDNDTTKRKFYQRIEVIGDKVPAVMQVRHTDNDYRSWSNYRTVDLSKDRPQLHQCGAARRRAWEFLCTDNQPIRLITAEVDYNIGDLE